MIGGHPGATGLSMVGMTTPNALAFLALGLVMFFGPESFPGFFVPSKITGGNTSALWLQFMGLAFGSLGSRFLLETASATFYYHYLAWRFPVEQPATPAVLRPAMVAAYDEWEDDDGRQLVA